MTLEGAKPCQEGLLWDADGEVRSYTASVQDAQVALGATKSREVLLMKDLIIQERPAVIRERHDDASMK